MATLMNQVEQLKTGNNQRDEGINRLRRQSETRGQSEARQRSETPAGSDASVAPTTVGSASSFGVSKPMAFKGDKYDGTAGNLGRFLNRLENDFVLYPQYFPTDLVKVAYAMSGLSEAPDQWAQQFFDEDPRGVRADWEAFKDTLKGQFGDPCHGSS